MTRSTEKLSDQNYLLLAAQDSLLHTDPLQGALHYEPVPIGQDIFPLLHQLALWEGTDVPGTVLHHHLLLHASHLPLKGVQQHLGWHGRAGH